ncbi:MAG: peptidase M23 [Chloroflexota bacterium]|nr:MAG: peptidase M23 [Chloroflexota bacterium]
MTTLRGIRRPTTAWDPSPGGLLRRRPSRRRRRLFVFFFLVPLLSGLVVTPGSPVARPVAGDELDDAYAQQRALDAKLAAQKRQVAELQALQRSVRADIAATQRALQAINADLAAVKRDIRRLEARIAEVEAAYAALVEQLAVLSTSLARIEAEEAAKAAALEERKALLAERIRAAYATDRRSLLEAVLSGESFADILTEVGAYLDVAEQDRALADQIERDQAQLASLRRTVEDLRTRTDELREDTAAQKAALDADLAELEASRARLAALEAKTERELARQKAAFAKLARNEAELKKAIAATEAAQEKLKARIDDLVRRQYAYGNIPSEYNGTLRWPLVGTITQEFGCTGFPWEPPLGSCAHFHRGIDIAAPLGTPIRAAGPGTVVFAGANPYDPPPKAWIVIIAHSQNLLTWYGHLTTSIPVRTGDVVSAGQVIGYVGMTGRTTGPHLHWMVEFNGTFVNPRLFV